MTFKVKYCLVAIFSVFFSFQSMHARGSFERVGDVFTLAPIGVLIISIGMRDYEGAWQLAAGTLATQGSIELIKRGFDFVHDKGLDVTFAKRPCCNNWHGMPSGHAGGSFSAAGFVYYRYGWKPALPLIGLGVITAASRVHARKHSILQVIAGSAIAWGFSYLFTTKYHPKTRFIVTPEIGSGMYEWDRYYGVNVSYRW